MEGKSPLELKNCNGVTALHICIYRNSVHCLEIVKLLLRWNDSFCKSKVIDNSPDETRSLASKTMNCGTTPLHIFAGQNLTLNQEILEILLQADPSVVFSDDVNFDNPLSLLWKNTLRFRWMGSLMNGTIDHADLTENDESCMTVITPNQFIKYSLLMIRAATRISNLTIHDICKSPRCPPVLVQTLLKYPILGQNFNVMGNHASVDLNGKRLLHVACESNKNVSQKYLPSSLNTVCSMSLISILLKEDPNSVRFRCRNGRVPLHYGLEASISENDIMLLVKLYPCSLRIRDPVTGLFPFMMVAANDNGLLRRSGTYATKTNARHHTERKSNRNDLVYCLLRLCPDVISASN